MLSKLCSLHCNNQINNFMNMFPLMVYINTLKHKFGIMSYL